MRKIPRLLLVSFSLLLLSVSVMAQNAVTGKVTDSKDGAPVAGATVLVKGTTTATKTGADGTFKINAPANAILVFTSIGFGTQEVNVSGKTFVEVAMVQANQQLNEVVVIGYGTTRKKDLTGVVNVVTSKDFQKGNITTPEQMISGKVPGVSITSNGGQPGSGSVIRIRGGSSLNASNDPLIVIDGVPLDQNGINGASNALSFINPNDIETFTVLKDASAAAIYGTRAANGVIIITTKKGKSGALKMNFTTNVSVASKTGEVDVLNGDQVRAIVAQLGNAKQKGQVGNANTNWQDAIYQNAVSNDNNLSFSGGIKGLPYRLSLGYSYLNGILKTDHLQKTSAALVLNPTFFHNTLKVDINLKASAENTRFANQGAIGGAVSFDPTQPIYSNSPRYGGYYEWLESNGDLVLNRPNNPVGVLQQTFDKQTPKRSIGNIQIDYAIPHVKGLHANLNLAYDVAKSTGTYFVNDSAAQAYVIGSPGIGGSSSQSKSTRQNTVADFYLNYVRDFAAIHGRLDLTAGYVYNNYLSTYYNYRGYNAHGDTIAGTKAPNFAYDKPENTLIGYFGRLNYSMSDKYFLTATFRRDGSSRFGPSNRYANFPSAAISWRVKNEDFLKNSKVVSDLKLRFGYGVTGQQDGIDNYSYLSYYSLSGPNSLTQFGNAYYYTYAPSGFYPNRKWEQTTGYNAGVDYGFINNRITGSVDVYLKKTKDLLNRVPQPAGTNFSSYILANVGNMENKGVEFNINVIPVKMKELTWDFNFNATYNKNTITNLTIVPKDANYQGAPGGGAAGVNGPIQLSQVGYAKRTFWLYHQVYDISGKPIEGLFEDVNRDGIINDKDRYLGKAPDANLFFGFSTNVAYKKWNAGFVLRANFNNYVYNNVYSNLGKLTQILDAYTIHNGSVNYLETGFAGKTDIQGFSDYYLENASFLRMDNISVGYNLGYLSHQKYALKLSANCQNVFVITKYKGLDPEVNGGIDNNLYPRPRIFTLGANLDF
ncbi:MAG: SusC/RagA family TonB-linked outer membrane protein [Bacteroidetes bacterium]|nr:SusC/RagA family TonB-linked outer membrane protein [Bacteroidota bacterium]